MSLQPSNPFLCFCRIFVTYSLQTDVVFILQYGHFVPRFYFFINFKTYCIPTIISVFLLCRMLVFISLIRFSSSFDTYAVNVNDIFCSFISFSFILYFFILLYLTYIIFDKISNKNHIHKFFNFFYKVIYFTFFV